MTERVDFLRQGYAALQRDDLEAFKALARGRLDPEFEFHLVWDGGVLKAGRMSFRMGLKTIDAGPGEVVTVPAGKAHKFANAGDGEAVARVTVTPALRMEDLFETTAELAHDGRVMESGMPKPLDLALFVREFKREVRGPLSPGALQRAMLAPLARIGRARGLADRYGAPMPATA